MKLMHPSFEEPIEFIEGLPNILVIESKKLRVRILEDLTNQMETGDGNFVLSDENNILKIEKSAELIINPFSLDINQKKVIAKIQSTIKELANNESNYAESVRIIGEVVSYFENLGAQLEYPVSFNDNIELQDLIKISGVKVEVESISFFENVWNYICLLNDILGIKIFIFWNLQLFVQEKELKELYKIANYKKIHLFFMESFDFKEHTLFERITIIDKDLCVIKNF